MARRPAVVDQATAYARAVDAGEILACKLLILACRRHLGDLERQHTEAFPYYFDIETAEKKIRFFGQLRHSKGKWAGSAFALQPWQAFIVGSLFGWKRSADGLRRFRTAYIELPRKNGKSTLAAGIALLLAFFDGEPGAEVYCAATKRDQARIVWLECQRMVRKTAALAKRIKIWSASLTRLVYNQILAPLGADADTLDGLNPHATVIDELHAHKTRDVVDVLESAVGAREQPMQFEITTAGFNQASVCYEHREYSEKVLTGIFADETWFAFIASIDKEDDWRELSSQIKANPNYGISVLPDDLRRLCEQAQRKPSAQNNFKTKRLNVWTEQQERWLSIEAWDACAGEPLAAGTRDRSALEPLLERLAGRPCFAALDLAATTDICALVLIFPEDDWSVLPFFWIPEARVELGVEQDRVPYDVWRDQGFLEVTPGNVTDYAYVRKRYNELAERFRIVETGYDPWNATQLMVELEQDGAILVKIPQNFGGLSAASKELEKRIEGALPDKSGKPGTPGIRHGAHPVLRWMASNVSIDKDANGNIKPSKKRSQRRIDGIVALVMALDRATRQGETRSVYETRGIAVLGAASQAEQDNNA